MSDAPGSTEAGLGAAKGGARSGAFSILTLVAIVVAVAALGFGGFMFMQLSSAKKQLARADVPEGLKEDEHAEEGHSDHASDDSPEPQEVVYELGDFTANTADAKFVKVNLALVVKSFYPREDWDNYQFELDAYEAARKAYFDFKKGAAEQGDGKKAKGGHAAADSGLRLAILLSGATPALASAPKKEPEPPALPEAPPVRPATRLEAKMKENDARVRNIIIEELNNVSSSELISAEGKEKFKQKVMDQLNAAFDRAYGEVSDIYFRELVTT